MLKSSVQHKILKNLPDDRPITAIQIIENIEKCPPGFYPISRTYDQDQDADLRESSIFKSSAARYLCLSKTEGLPNFVVQEIVVLNEKLNPPKGFSLLNRTADSEQKAWRKKQLCYRLVNLKETRLAITDVIVCSRLKKAPEGFSFAGEVNGVTICYKMGNVQDTQANSPDASRNSNGQPIRSAPAPPGGNPVYPSLANDDGDYEILLPGYPPARPAPKPPTPNTPQPSTYPAGTHTLGSSSFNGMEGVPFVLNPKYGNSSGNDKFQFPRIRAKTMQQILKEYDYPFTLERQT